MGPGSCQSVERRQHVNLDAVRGDYGVKRVLDLPGSFLEVARQTALEISPDLITDLDVMCQAKEE